MTVNGKPFKPFIGSDEIAHIVDRLALQIGNDYAGCDLVVCPILTGAYMFAADLLRRIPIPCEVSFVRYSSYCGMSSTGEVKSLLPFTESIKGRDILIVEDVIDTGLSMQAMLDAARRCAPASVEVCTLLFKPHAFRGGFNVQYVGREIGNEFIVGYGMDYDEKGRNLPEVYVIDQ